MVNLFTKVLNPLISALLRFYGLTSQTVEINPGTVIHFWAPSPVMIKSYKNRQAKLATKPSLVFLHGFAGTGALTWLPQIMAFAGKYSVFLPDLLFFGGSTTDSPNRSPKFHAECLAKGLKLLGVESCTVVGCSYGGIVGSKMAESDPKLVRCLVLSNSNVGATESQSKAVFERVRVGSWPELLLPETVEGLKVLLGFVIRKRPWLPDWAYGHYLEVMFNNRSERAELINAAIVKDDEFYIPNFSQKIYYLAGEEDKIFDIEILNETKRNLGEKATLHCIKKAGHLVHLERPLVYNRLLEKILASFEADK